MTAVRELLGRHFAAPLELPPLDRIAVSTQDSSAHVETINRLVGRSYLRRLLRSCATLAGPNDPRWAELSHALLSLEPDVLSDLVSGPEITTVVNVVNRDSSWSFERVLAELARVVFPVLALHAPESSLSSYTVARATDPGRLVLPLPSSGLVVITTPDDLTPDLINVGDGAVVVRRGSEVVARLGFAGRTVVVEDLRDGCGCTHVPEASGVGAGAVEALWTETMIDGSPRPVSSAMALQLLPQLQTSLHEALELLDRVWPDAGRDTKSIVRRVLPLDPALPKRGYTAHQSRGTVWAKPAAPHELAQILVHEGGHSLLCSVIDLCELAANQRAVVRSPIGEDRPLYGVFHAAISFTREAILAESLLENGFRTSLGLDLGDYHGEVLRLATESIALLDHTAELTEQGAELTTGLAAALADRTARRSAVA